MRNEFEIDADLRRQVEEQLRGRAPADDLALDGEEFNPTFTSSRHERAWILGALGPFYEQRWITDVLRIIKGGKEANVYHCAADPTLGVAFVAAKVYRPRMFRNLSNDAIYREGRERLDDQGKSIRDHRRQRAIRKKTRFGRKLEITSWIEHEYRTMQALYDAGADVPRPYAQSENTILMEYVGGDSMAAPILHQVDLERHEAVPLFERLLHNVELMLACDRIHGDLSAYNVLYWKGEAKIIDFPQAVDARFNPSAMALLMRDVERLYQYFARYGVAADAAGLALDLWRRYEHGQL